MVRLIEHVGYGEEHLSSFTREGMYIFLQMLLAVCRGELSKNGHHPSYKQMKKVCRQPLDQDLHIW